MAQKKPIKEKYIVYFHAIEHHKKSPKELQKAEVIAYAVPRGNDSRPYEHQNSYSFDYPTNDMRTGEPFLFIRYRIQIFLRRR